MRTASCVLLCASSLCLLGCQRKHVAEDAFPSIAEPSCGTSKSRQVIVKRELLSTRLLRDGRPRETFEIVRRGCLYEGHSVRENNIATTETTILYDANGRPLHVLKRTFLNGLYRDKPPDEREYELRTPEVFLRHKKSSGATEIFRIRGARPKAILDNSPGLTSMWFIASRLSVGERVRIPVMDLRGVEKITPVSIVRDADRIEPSLLRTVRVYRYLGGQSVFTDERDLVVGDLAGMRMQRTAHE